MSEDIKSVLYQRDNAICKLSLALSTAESMLSSDNYKNLIEKVFPNDTTENVEQTHSFRELCISIDRIPHD